MFGKNKIMKQDLSGGLTLSVQAIFPTIQGECIFAGRPAVFIRLAGCNLRCFFCDTDFESQAKIMDIAQITAEVEVMAAGVHRLVVITGGEPFRQNISPLVKTLLHKGYIVQMETAGTLSLVDFPFEDENLYIVTSPKTGKIHPDIARYSDAFKYIIKKGETDPVDGLPIMSTQNEGLPVRIYRPVPPEYIGKETDFHGRLIGWPEIWVQACDEYDAEKNKANLQEAARIAQQYGYTLSVQTHKIVGVE